MPRNPKKVQISVSSAPVAKLGDKRYYDLLGTVEVMKKCIENQSWMVLSYNSNQNGMVTIHH